MAGGISRVIAGFPGFLHQTVLRPSPPAQVDWVILQRFADINSATAWLRSANGTSAWPACGRC